jgi:hypothetical protein
MFSYTQAAMEWAMKVQEVILRPRGPGAHLLLAIRAHGEPGQHGDISEPDVADRAGALAGTLAGCTVTVHQHLDRTLSLSNGPHCLGRYDERGGPILHSKLMAGKAVEETPPRRRLREINETGHFTCYKKRTF